MQQEFVSTSAVDEKKKLQVTLSNIQGVSIEAETHSTSYKKLCKYPQKNIAFRSD